MPYVIGEVEVTNEVTLAPNAVIYDGAIVADGDLSVKVNGFYYNLDGDYGRYVGSSANVVADNSVNYVYLSILGILTINATGYPVGSYIQLGRVVTSGGFIVRVILERPLLSATLPSGGFVPNTLTLTAGAGLTGGGDLSANRTFDVVANADGSIIVNTNDIQVGILASDTQHGSLGGGSTHSAATTSVNGFMSSSDKTKLDGVASGSTNTPLTATAPEDVTKSTAAVGVATDAARADHKHNVTTATPGATTPGDSAAEGTATSLARSDHQHSLPSFGTTSTTFCVGNDSRLSDDRTASGIRTSTTVVVVSGATAPTNGQVLTASSGTAAAWATPTVYAALTSNTPADVTKSSASIGVGTTAARDDHKHDVSTAAAGAATPGDTTAEGSATSLARSDHRHSLPSFGTTSTTFCVGNDSRLSDDRTASGIRTATTVVVVSGATAPTNGQVLTASSGTAAAWSTPAAGVTLASSAPVDITKAAAAVGVGTTAARDDHKHDVSTAAAGAATPGDTTAEGSATSLARSDHRHSLPSFGTGSGTFCQGNDSRLSDDRTASGIRTATTVVSLSSATAPSAGQILIATSGTAATWQYPLDLSSTAPVNVTKAAAVTGVGTTAARDDHKHDITTTSPATTSVVIGNSVSEGIATSLARSDHQHSVSSGSPVSIGVTNTDGTATTFARSDHGHNHGAQTSGTLHAVATGSVNGFMSSTDKSKLDLMSPDFGRDYTSAQSLGQSTTTATTYQSKLSMATGALTGTYLITWYCLMSRPSGGNSVFARFYNTTSSTVVGGVWSKDQLQVTDKLQFSGSAVITLSGTSNTYIIQYQGGGGNTAAIEEARIEMWRVSA
jgi:hypothetical protein